MSLALHRSDDFTADFDLQYRWYLREVGEAVAERYLAAVLVLLGELARQPGIGRERNFRHPELQGLRSFVLKRPFQRHIIFYRALNDALSAERILHGMRDLPRRLREAPGVE